MMETMRFWLWAWPAQAIFYVGIAAELGILWLALTYPDGLPVC